MPYRVGISLQVLFFNQQVCGDIFKPLRNHVQDRQPSVKLQSWLHLSQVPTPVINFMSQPGYARKYLGAQVEIVGRLPHFFSPEMESVDDSLRPQPFLYSQHFRASPLAFGTFQVHFSHEFIAKHRALHCSQLLIFSKVPMVQNTSRIPSLIRIP